MLSTSREIIGSLLRKAFIARFFIHLIMLPSTMERRYCTSKAFNVPRILPAPRANNKIPVDIEHIHFSFL
jgi:hypothetical protein